MESDMRLKTLLVLLMISMLAGCASGDKKGAELLDTAKFEEKQNNYEHAARLYDEILKKYPGSPAAQEATTRLGALKNRKP
jgi:TolA-binding protein